MKQERKEGEIIQSHAIIARFVYGEDGALLSIDQYDLTPGAVLIFVGTQHDPEDTVSLHSGDQDALLQVMEKINTRQEVVQLIAILDRNTGSLLITDGIKDNSYGISSQIPTTKRVISAYFGKSAFGIIWGETRQEAYQTLARLQAERLRGSEAVH